MFVQGFGDIDLANPGVSGRPGYEDLAASLRGRIGVAGGMVIEPPVTILQREIMIIINQAKPAPDQPAAIGVDGDDEL
jgi:hypothetical protein